MSAPWNAEPTRDDDPAESPPPYDLDEPPEAAPVEAEPGRETCWRCAKSVAPVRGLCPVCRARLREIPKPHRTARRAPISGSSVHDDIHSVKAVMWMFVLLLSVSVVQGWYLHGDLNLARMPRQQQQQVLLDQLIIFSAVDSILLMVALAWARTPPSVITSADRRLGMWLLAAPLLGVLLGVNFLYHYLLTEYLGAANPNEIIALGWKDHLFAMLLLVCVQPAVVEELFFRYLAFGHLRRVMGDHGAILVSSVMFGVAHIHNPLSVPVLVAVGVGLGYARWLSGGMILPMLMHGLHNLVVLIVEANR
jgi:uncharacterized protein